VTERWLPIPGYEALYEVSDHGRVRSAPRTITYRDGRTRHYPSHILSPAATASGHRQVVLCGYGRQRSLLTHRLLMLAFVGPCPPGQEIRHLDGDPSHTALANLAYGTRAENVLDRVRHGTHHQASKTRCPVGHPYDDVNTYVQPSRPGARFCRTCRADRNRRRKQVSTTPSRSWPP
jgi:hypothetical protein